MATVYVAGKLALGKPLTHDIVRITIDLLQSHDHEIIFDWTQDARARTPYSEHASINAPIAAEMVEAAMEAEVFVLVVDARNYGAMVEFGAALAAFTQRFGYMEPLSNLFVVYGKREGMSRESIFFTLPCVNYVSQGEFLDIVKQGRLTTYGRDVADVQ